MDCRSACGSPFFIVRIVLKAVSQYRSGGGRTLAGPYAISDRGKNKGGSELVEGICRAVPRESPFSFRSVREEHAYLY